MYYLACTYYYDITLISEEYLKNNEREGKPRKNLRNNKI